MLSYKNIGKITSTYFSMVKLFLDRGLSYCTKSILCSVKLYMVCEKRWQSLDGRCEISRTISNILKLSRRPDPWQAHLPIDCEIFSQTYFRENSLSQGQVRILIKTIEKCGWKAVISEMWWKWSRCCDAGYSFNNQSSFPILVPAFRKKKMQNQFRFFLLWSVFTDKPASGEEGLNEYGDCIKWKTWPASVHYSIITNIAKGTTDPRVEFIFPK